MNPIPARLCRLSERAAPKRFGFEKFTRIDNTCPVEASNDAGGRNGIHHGLIDLVVEKVALLTDPPTEEEYNKKCKLVKTTYAVYANFFVVMDRWIVQ
jgi:hypothetical protein